MKRKGKAAFSLVELLVVIGLILLLAMLVGETFRGMGRSVSVASEGRIVLGSLNLARQAALSRSRVVEVRFYRLPDPARGDGPSDYRALQVFSIEATSTNAVTPVHVFAAPVVIADAPSASTLMDDKVCPETPPGTGDGKMPGAGMNYRYRRFSFRPDGSTDLPPDGSWFLTLVEKGAPMANGSGVPSNFATIQVDPQNGRVKFFQP